MLIWQNLTIFRRSQKVQAEMVFLKGDQPFFLHQAQFPGQGAAVDAQISGQLLPGKGNGKGGGLTAGGLQRQIRQNPLPQTPLG